MGTAVGGKRRRRRKPLPVQLTLDQARKPDGKHGGWRPGAGRPRGRKKVAHVVRETFTWREPLHVTWRIAEGVRSLRCAAVLEVVRDRLAKFANGDDFRVVEFNVLGNHVHLVVEAAGPAALARGMQGLAVRLARAINKLLGRTGKLFQERYHARVLRQPLQVRNVLRYVLLNARHHAAERGETLSRYWVDPFSSAPWFDGWKERIRNDADWLTRLRRRPRPTAMPRSWLLRVGWRKRGLLAFDEVPGSSHEAHELPVAGSVPG
ncbi:MAG TPA: transposase [Kofleriaceae bacterium]|nr:transposase [Kofleriaceae bacterium]